MSRNSEDFLDQAATTRKFGPQDNTLQFSYVFGERLIGGKISATLRYAKFPGLGVTKMEGT